jgi:hypothetical protein
MPDEVVVTVRRMAELCQLSRSRFYDLVDSGVFPKPVQHPSSKRPMFDRQLQDKCLEIRRTGIGANGIPVLFNRKPKRTAPTKIKADRPVKLKPDPAIESLLDALKGLGLTPTPQVVMEAITDLYPTGIAGLDQGDVIRNTFLYLQGKRP